MRHFLKLFLILAAISFTLVSLSQAADTPKKGYDKYGKPLPGTKSSFNPPLAATAPQAVAQGNSLQSSVNVDPLPCRDFQFAGDVILPVNRGDDYLCPPGYECKGVVGGFQCRWRNFSTLAANSPECRMDSCNAMALGKAISDAYGQH